MQQILSSLFILKKAYTIDAFSQDFKRDRLDLKPSPKVKPFSHMNNIRHIAIEWHCNIVCIILPFELGSHPSKTNKQPMYGIRILDFSFGKGLPKPIQNDKDTEKDAVYDVWKKFRLLFRLFCLPIFLQLYN